MVCDLETVRHLSESIGPRFGGTTNERRAAEYVTARMRSLGLSVATQEFGFVGWQSTRPPALELLEPSRRSFEASSFMFSDSTPEGGLQGRIEYVGDHQISITGKTCWPKYAIVDSSGKEIAFLVARPKGLSASLPLILGRIYGCAPYVCVGEECLRELEGICKNGVTARMRVDVGGQLLPGLVSQNVIGTLVANPQSQEEVIVCSHHDTAHDSPGAVDNASGVSAMLRIAQMLAKGRCKSTVRFISFGCEEYHILGSRYYVDRLKEKAGIQDVKGVVCIDGVGLAGPLTVWAEQDEFRKQIVNALGSKLTGQFQLDFRDPRIGSDHWPFHQQGVPTALLTSLRVFDFQHYHRSTDTCMEIDRQQLDDATTVGAEIVNAVANWPGR